MLECEDEAALRGAVSTSEAVEEATQRFYAAGADRNLALKESATLGHVLSHWQERGPTCRGQSRN